MNKTWQFQESHPFLRPVYRDINGDMIDERTGWETKIIYDGEPITVTWYGENRINGGLQVEGGADMDERTGKEAGTFGLVLIKLMVSGENLMNDLSEQ